MTYYRTTMSLRRHPCEKEVTFRVDEFEGDVRSRGRE